MSYIFKDLQERFEANQDSILKTVEARSRDRLKFLESTIERRKTKDIEDIEGILAELEAAMEFAQGRMRIKMLGAKEALMGGVSRVVLGDARQAQPVRRALDGIGTVLFGGGR